MKLRLCALKVSLQARWTRWLRQLAPEQVLPPGLAAAICGMVLLAVGAWTPLERVAYTSLFLIRDRLHPLQWDDRLVVIAIDEESLATYGIYPWSRDHYTRLLERLIPVQPAAVGFGILMPESTPADAAFAESIRFSSNVVLSVGNDPLGHSIQVAPSVIGPTEGFVRMGHVKQTPDTDGLSRQAFLYEIHGTQIAASFAIAIADAYQTSLEGLITADPINVPKMNPRFMTEPGQFDQHQPLWLNWPSATRPLTQSQASMSQLKTLSYAEVMAPENSHLLDDLQNKIVLVGYTAVGTVGEMEDAVRTPFERQIPTASIYFHAAVIDNLLNDRFLQRLPPIWTLLGITLIGIGSSFMKWTPELGQLERVIKL